MVLFNYSTKELTAKIVYYGPGLCGKTTNLQFVFESLPDEKRGRMLSLSTQTDRTLYFDFLPMDLGEIRGMKTRIQLYTVPGQVFYNETRKMVLKGVDGVVFVADSQTQMADANLESFRNLLENLEQHGADPTTIPTVLQFNKRDLPSILTVEEMNAALNRFNSPFYEAIATTGIGVHDTLKAISKLVLRALSSKSKEDRPAVPTHSDVAVNQAVRATPESETINEEAVSAAPSEISLDLERETSSQAPDTSMASPPSWSEESLDDQLDQMDAAEIEGLLQDVDGFDLDGAFSTEINPDATPVAEDNTLATEAGTDTAADPLGNGASDEFSFGIHELTSVPDEPAPGLSPAPFDTEAPEQTPASATTEFDTPDPFAAPGGGEDLDSVALTGTSELTIESFLAENDGPAPPEEPQPASISLTNGGDAQVPISMTIDGRTVRYLLTLRLEPEDLASRR